MGNGDRSLRPPGEAYEVMERALAVLSRSYFETAPPAQGIHVVVTGADGISTTWDVPIGLGETLERMLQRHPTITVDATPYDRRRVDHRTGRPFAWVSREFAALPPDD